LASLSAWVTDTTLIAQSGSAGAVQFEGFEVDGTVPAATFSKLGQVK
jgi:hypothetical protein